MEDGRDEEDGGHRVAATRASEDLKRTGGVIGPSSLLSISLLSYSFVKVVK